VQRLGHHGVALLQRRRRLRRGHHMHLHLRQLQGPLHRLGLPRRLRRLRRLRLRLPLRLGRLG